MIETQLVGTEGVVRLVEVAASNSLHGENELFRGRGRRGESGEKADNLI